MSANLDRSLDDIINDNRTAQRAAQQSQRQQVMQQQQQRQVQAAAARPVAPRVNGPVRGVQRGVVRGGIRKPAGPYQRPVNAPNGQWNHDLFQQHARNAQAAINPQLQKRLDTNPLLARLQGPTAPKQQQQPGNAVSFKGAAQAQNVISIKGASGPTTVEIANLAPGTSPDDIQTTMQACGKVTQVKITGVSKIALLAEVTFATRKEADVAVSKFHQINADGRIIRCQIKQAAKTAQAPTPSGPRAQQQTFTQRTQQQVPMQGAPGRMYNANGRGGFGRR